MVITSGNTYWNNINKNFKRYPSLNQNINCDVVIVGGGITGCLTLYYLSQFNINAVLIEKNIIGNGSTSASTGLLRYETDMDLHSLINKIGEKKAVRVYKLCQKAIDDIENIIYNVKQLCDFERKDSLYLCSSQGNVSKMRKEYRTRKEQGFKVSFLEKSDIESLFSFTSPCGIYSYDCGQFDPLLFSHSLLKNSQRDNSKIYENTSVYSFDYFKNSVRVNLDNGSYINCKKIVMAAGYSSVKYLDMENKVNLSRSHSIVTNRLKSFNGWSKKCSIRKGCSPYTYIRSTIDNRVLIDGLNEPFGEDFIIDAKSNILLDKLNSMFPQLPNPKIEYSWSEIFTDIKNGFGFIGKHPKYPNTYMNFGFGSNGTTFSVIGAQIIKDLILYDNNPDADIFQM
ncbi:FAD-dependent oxidoreductase [Clostridium sediminicola]|uniref:NAD(P)/FAD-dependent oxidoreductase n=1 Tax=Clostridium sediminicola TaxID=3114879 RepID=UPI0031F1DE8A